MMRKAQCLTLCGCLFSWVAYSGTMGNSVQPSYSPHPWQAVASMGYTIIENTGPGTGQTALGRFALGKSFYDLGERDTDSNPYHATLLNFGVEFGVQNGARLSVGASQDELNLFSDTDNGNPILSTLRSMLDVLGTLTFAPLESEPFFVSAKLGLAYRQWQMDYTTINNLSQITGELQAGIGMPIGEAAAVSILYQGIYGSNPNLTIDGNNNASVRNIPQQNGVLASVSLLL